MKIIHVCHVRILFTIVSLIFCTDFAVSQVTESFHYTIRNQTVVAGNIVEFDLLLLDTDTLTTIEIATVQAGILVNPDFFDGGTVTASILPGSSTMNANQVPTSITFTQTANCLKLASKAPPGNGNGTIMSQDSLNPTRLCRIRLTNSMNYVGCTCADLMFNFTVSPYPTKISAYINGLNSALLVNSLNCFTVGSLMITNCDLLNPYDITGQGCYCQGSPGRELGLNGSSPGVNYQLIKDGILQSPLFPGTGEALSFGIWPAGSYIAVGSYAGCGGTISGQMNGSAVIMETTQTPPLFSPQGPYCMNEAAAALPDTSLNGISGSWEPPVVNSDFPGIFPFTFTPDETFCASDTTIFITVDSLPQPTISGPDTATFNSSRIYITEPGMNNYSWDVGGGTFTQGGTAADNFVTISWNKPAPYFVSINYTNGHGCLAANPVLKNVTVIQNKLLKIRVFLEGLYAGRRAMYEAYDENGPHFGTGIADKIQIELHNPANYNTILFSSPATDLLTDGSASVVVPATFSGSGYLTINNRNHIETTSFQPISFPTDTVLYDFSTAANKAYGGNMLNISGVYVLWGGDENKDGLVDASDMIDIENDVVQFTSGYYSTDLNGDGLVDAADLIIADNNANMFTSTVLPPSLLVITSPVSTITFSTVTAEGSVVSEGSSAVMERGFCYSKMQGPTLNELHISAGAGIGDFIAVITGLETGATYYIRAYAINATDTVFGNEVIADIPWGCGIPVSLHHIKNIFAPVTKAVTYGTMFNIPGEPAKCWITQNLGASHQAASINDTSESSAGWYWQFNRQQGYRHDGIIRTPEIGWVTSIYENLDWQPENDPCTGLLGGSWRIPTYSEWENVRSGGTLNGSSIYESILKLHFGGLLIGSEGSLTNRGSLGLFWSRNQYNNAEGWNFYNDIDQSFMLNYTKKMGLPLRCVCDTVFAAALPLVSTTPVNTVTTSSIMTGGEVISDGGSEVIARGVCWSTSQYPTVNDSATADGSGIGSFVSSITGLNPNTTYYCRAFATNSIGTAYGQSLIFASLIPGGGPCPGLPTITYGGQTYNTAQIGTQCWLRENLNIGTRIDLNTNSSDNGILEKHCFNNDESNCDKYGGLYDWDEMMQYSLAQSTRGICPEGWHVPSNNEWSVLSIILGGTAIAGGKLKETGIVHWANPNQGATNESGFTALPFKDNGDSGGWFTSSECDPGSPDTRYVNSFDTYLVAHLGCSKNNTYYGNPLSVRCLLDDSTRQVSAITSIVTGITSNSAKCGGETLPNGGAPPIERGVCWSTHVNPTLADAHTADGSGFGVFISSVTGLSPDTVYHVRAYATNIAGTVYGNERIFSTRMFGLPCPGVDSVIYEGLTYHAVKIGNQCWLKENLNVGVRIDQSQPQSNNSVIEKYCLGRLESNCDIYGGLYQWNEMMQYSTTPVVQGICPPGWHLPTHTEWTILSDYLGGTSVAGGKLKQFGTATWNSPNYGATDESGFMSLPGDKNLAGNFNDPGYNAFFWSSTESYEYNSFEWSLTFSNGGFHSNEFAYKNEALSARCLMDDTLQLALVTTAAVSNITQNSALGGGDVYHRGGSNVSEKGVCFSLNSLPTIADPHSSDGNGEGVFGSILTGLIPDTTYYVRAFAINNGGVAYGNEVSFMTSDTGLVASVITSAVIDVTLTSAISGGIVNSQGSSAVTARGVCWSQTMNPTILDSHTIDGSGEGTFTSYITGLGENLTYHIRAYASNAEGTAYGTDLTFQTYVGPCLDQPTVLYEGQTYNTVKIGDQCWLKENLNIGTRIDGSQNQTNNSSIEKYCYNNWESNCSIYGGLYQWNEMMQYSTVPGTQGICPAGWHIPTQEDWNSLINYLGDASVAGGKMKETGFTHWLPPNSGATNEVGFTALGGGDRGNYSGNPFEFINYFGTWWSSTQSYFGYPFGYKLESQWDFVYGSDMTSFQGNSVRCIRDGVQ